MRALNRELPGKRFTAPGQQWKTPPARLAALAAPALSSIEPAELGLMIPAHPHYEPLTWLPPSPGKAGRSRRRRSPRCWSSPRHPSYSVAGHAAGGDAADAAFFSRVATRLNCSISSEAPTRTLTGAVPASLEDTWNRQLATAWTSPATGAQRPALHHPRSTVPPGLYCA